MELIVTILLAFPIGYLVKDKLTAFVAYIAIHSFVFTFQCTELTREWIGGDNSAFPKDPHTGAWSYGVVNLVIYGAGFGLVLLGRKVARRRSAKALDGVDLAAS